MQPQQLMNAFPLPIMPDDQLDAPVTVQRWGALLVCHARSAPPPNESSLVIADVSDNCESVLSYCAAELLRHPLSSIVDRQLAEELREDAERRRGGVDVYAERDVILHSGACVHLVAHAHDGRVIVDALPVLEADYAEEDFADSAHELGERLHGARDAASCSQSAVEVVNRLLRFDRCLVYRFVPPHNHGEVIAESLLTAPSAPLPALPAPSTPVTMPFLGLRFPPHPLTQRIQSVYRRAAMRVIADTIDTGAVLLSACSGGSPEDGCSPLTHLDLQYSSLRAISPVQAEQFLAIGVRAAATFVLFVEGKAWGALLLSGVLHTPCALPCLGLLLTSVLVRPVLRAHNSPRAIPWRTVGRTGPASVL